MLHKGEEKNHKEEVSSSCCISPKFQTQNNYYSLLKAGGTNSNSGKESWSLLVHDHGQEEEEASERLINETGKTNHRKNN